MFTKKSAGYEKLNDDANQNVEEDQQHVDTSPKPSNEQQQEPTQPDDDQPPPEQSPPPLVKQPGEMFVQIKTPDDKAVKVVVPETGSVLDLKNAVHGATGFPPERQRLIFSGQLLNNDDKTLASCRVQDNSFVHLVPKLHPTPCEPPREEAQDEPHLHEHPFVFDGHQRQLPVAITIEDLNNANVGPHSINFVTHIWRARVKLVAAVMFFYFSLDLVGEISLLTDPDGGDNAHVSGWRKHAAVIASRMFTDIIGIGAGVVGSQAANAVDSRLTARFYRYVMILSICYVWNGVYDVVELVHDDRMRQSKMHHPTSLGFSIIVYLMMCVSIWGTCVGTAGQYHRAILREEEQRNGITPPEPTVTQTRIVLSRNANLDVV